MKSITKQFAFASLILSIMLILACENSNNSNIIDYSDSDSDGDSDSDSDGDSDGDSDSDSDSDTDFNPDFFGTISGKVVSATGFPISEALVYIKESGGPNIPNQIYCYQCDDMTGLNWTQAAADGTFTIAFAPKGTTKIITRKGDFQREREITIIGGSDIQYIPQEYTTLPGQNSKDGFDQIPNYALHQDRFDTAEDMLAKMGLGKLNDDGKLDISQPYFFDMYDPNNGSPIGNTEESSFLLSSLDQMSKYHMLFFPCWTEARSFPGVIDPKSPEAPDLIPSIFTDVLQRYVSAGGKVYASCYASHWPESIFPDVIKFHGSEKNIPGGQGRYDTYGTINDEAMRKWLAVVESDEDIDDWPFDGAWVVMDYATDNAYDGHGVVIDSNGSATIDGPVIPTIWVTDNQHAPGSPLTVTYPYDCGKIFYASYQVVESYSDAKIRPQEWILIYLFYEIAVCDGSYVDPE